MESQKAMIKMSIFAELYKFVKPLHANFLVSGSVGYYHGRNISDRARVKACNRWGFNDPSYQRLNEAVSSL